MSVARYVGSAIAPARTRLIRDPQRGIQLVTYYEGTLDQIDAVIGAVANDQRYEKEESGNGMYQLSVYTPDVAGTEGPFDQQDTWELLNNRVEKDLYEHPRSKAIHSDNIQALRRWMKNPDGPILWTDAGTADEGDLLAELLLKGTTKFTTGEYALRYTITVSSRAEVNASFANVEKLWTTAQLTNAAVAGYLTIPTGIGFAISDIPEKTAPTGYLWSWLKQGPTVRTQNGKLIISQEFWLDLWSTYIYSAAS